MSETLATIAAPARLLHPSSMLGNLGHNIGDMPRKLSNEEEKRKKKNKMTMPCMVLDCLCFKKTFDSNIFLNFFLL